jgi:hypothetical protein
MYRQAAGLFATFWRSFYVLQLKFEDNTDLQDISRTAFISRAFSSRKGIYIVVGHNSLIYLVIFFNLAISCDLIMVSLCSVLILFRTCQITSQAFLGQFFFFAYCSCLHCFLAM